MWLSPKEMSIDQADFLERFADFLQADGWVKTVSEVSGDDVEEEEGEGRVCH